MSIVRQARCAVEKKAAWCKKDAWAQKLLAASAFALATSYAAQVKISLPWTPVPITLQTFVVLLSGLMLGARWGAASQVLYVALGAFGLPLFSGMDGGLGIVLGPRGGYIVGFVISSFILGCLTGKYHELKNFLPMICTLACVLFVVIYGLGCLQLGCWLWLVKGSCPSIKDVLMMGAVPFVLGDLVKIVGVALLQCYRFSYTRQQAGGAA